MIPMIENQAGAPFRVTDLKQWYYCPRILYYAVCLPKIRPTTYKMEAGVEAGAAEEAKEARRSLQAYGLREGRREFHVRVESQRLGLRGEVDMVIWVGEHEPVEAIPVDYKLSRVEGAHFKMQLAAYGLLLEEQFGIRVSRGFLYMIPEKRSKEVRFTPGLKNKTLETLEAMHAMLWGERLPEATPQRAKCVACEFRRFCNDVF